MLRNAMLLGAVAMVLGVGCTSSDEAQTAPDAAAPGATTVAPAATSAPSIVPTTTTEPSPAKVVTVEVQIPDRALGAAVAAEFDLGGDPFDDAFATCSAYRSVSGAYSVGVGGPDTELPWVSIVSAGRIDGAGEVAADVRVDLPDGGEIDAMGSMVLDADLASGSFTATASDGGVVEGTFDCAGSERPPVTMAATDVGAIEVVAIVERDGSERVVTAATLDATEADCPAAGGAEPLVIAVDGDASLGAISSFRIERTAATTALRLSLGETTYEFDDVVLELDEAARAGTFVATGDVSVTGAFSCT